MSKQDITLQPSTETNYECCQSLIPVLMVEWLLPVLIFALNHCCQSWKGIFIRGDRASLWHPRHVARRVESFEDAPGGIDEEIAQWLKTVNDVLDVSKFAPDILTTRKVITKGLLGHCR